MMSCQMEKSANPSIAKPLRAASLLPVVPPPRFSELPDEFVCAHRHGCPYLEGLLAKWVWDRYQSAAGLECQYEAQLEELNTELAQAQGRIRELETKV
jgi:hypothetical protein